MSSDADLGMVSSVPRPAPPTTLRLDEAKGQPQPSGQPKSVSFTMDANHDTVRSMATLLVMDQEQEDKMRLSPNTARKVRRSPVTGRKAVTKSSSSSVNGVMPKRVVTPQASLMSETQGPEDHDNISDSVFGDIPLEEHLPVKVLAQRSLSNEEYLATDRPPLRRQGSLRSQLSVSSSQKEPVKRELKLKTFVSILFIIIVTGVSVVLHFAKSKKYDVEVGMKIIVHEDTRMIEYQNTAKQIKLMGKFGLGIPENILPIDCSDDETRKTHLCLKWRDHAQVHIDYWEDRTSKCYNIGWQSLNKDTLLKDCMDLNLHTVRWYGGWVSSEQTWPFRNVSIPLQPYITGQPHNGATFGPVLERYWLSSKGVGIFSADTTAPLHVSWNAQEHQGNHSVGDGQFCLVSGMDHHMYGSQAHTNPALGYTVCVSSHILDVHRLSLSQISQRHNVSAQGERPDMALFSSPVWSATKALRHNLTQGGLEDLARNISNLNLSVGVLMIEDHWQTHHGDLVFDSSFSNVQEMLINLTRQLHCHIALGLDPYTSIYSKNFADIASDQLLVRDGSGVSPGLLRWTDATSAEQSKVVGVLDFTSPDTVTWYKDKLNILKKSTSVNILYNFQGGEASMLPYGATLSGDRTNNNLYTFHYGLMASLSSRPAILDSVTHFQTHGVIVRVQIPSLKHAIPTVLTLGILGYPYVMAELNTPLESVDLYIRSVQLAAFLPIMHISAAPDTYGLKAINVFRYMTNLRRTLINPRIIRSQADAPMDPIVRPLWWIAPDDPVALSIDSEFLVGNDLLVAPVMQEWAIRRDIYLPKGTWFSKERVKHRGPKWLWDYKVPPLEFAYFTKH